MREVLTEAVQNSSYISGNSKLLKEVSDEMAVVVGSLAKLYCGELVESGLLKNDKFIL